MLTQYTHSFVLLNQYDTGNFPKGGLNERVIDVIKPQEAAEAIDRLRETLIEQKEASVLFGSSKDERFIGILSSIVQSFEVNICIPASKSKRLICSISL